MVVDLVVGDPAGGLLRAPDAADRRRVRAGAHFQEGRNPINAVFEISFPIDA